MNKVSAPTVKKIGYGLVRDRAGNPKIDDPVSVPMQIIDMLTSEDWQRLDAETRETLERRKAWLSL